MIQRDTENGVKLSKVSIFTRGGKNGVTLHVFGIKEDGCAQVCSPIRNVSFSPEGLVFVTRSYNKYVVNYDSLVKMDKIDHFTFLTHELYFWLGTDRILQIVDKEDLNSSFLKLCLYSGDVHPVEKKLYFGGQDAASTD